MTVREHMAIALATRHFKFEGARETDAREQLGMSATRFWQYVNALLDRPDVLAAYPREVYRLQRLRDLRRRRRRAS